MQKWADANNSAWNHYFSYANVNRATYDIRDGKISPWLLLNCQSGKKLLSSMNDEQLNSISVIIDPIIWVKKFKNLKHDLELVKQIVKEANL
jgi:uroporphyrinogen-III decarboxylase